MRRTPLAWLVLLLSAPAIATIATERHVYQETTGSRSTRFEWTLEPDADGIRILAVEPGQHFQTRCDRSGATIAWQINGSSDHIAVQRSADRLELRGTRHGQPYSGTILLDNAPWFQAMSFSLRAWLATGATHIEFWTLRPDTLEAVKLRAERMGEATVDLRTGPVRAVHLRVRASGLRAAFWKADYWFRADDLLFVKYLAVNGLPGTPPTTIELIGSAGVTQEVGL